MTGRLLVSADLHFGHKNIIEYCQRPWMDAAGRPQVREMNVGLVERWNDTVGDSDRVIFCGDLAFGPRSYQAQWAQQLRGRKTLVLGNHDRLSRATYLEMGFEDVARTLQIGRVWFCHYPPTTQTICSVQAAGCEVVICGHVHERWAEREVRGIRVINVGVDVREYRPVVLTSLGIDPGLLTR